MAASRHSVWNTAKGAIRNLDQKLSRAFYVADSGEDFLTHRSRPVRDAERHPFWRPDHRADTGIVLQGPVLRENDFTFHTVLRYRRNFPEAPIVVSTWEHELGEVTERLESLGVVIVSQVPPKLRGASNSNMQMMSAHAGVKEVSKRGLKYVVKTRTDQRIYSERFLGLFHEMLRTFPVGNPGGQQIERIVGVSLNTFAYRMYGLSDMVTFGATEDVVRYWDGFIDERDFTNWQMPRSHREYALGLGNETMYCSRFLNQTGWNLKWNTADSWNAFAQRFVIVDSSSIDLFWPKYTRKEERWRSYQGDPRWQEMDFAWWMMIRRGSIDINEAVLDEVWAEVW